MHESTEMAVPNPIEDTCDQREDVILNPNVPRASCLEHIPVVNIIYDLLFSSHPTYSDVERLLNVVALLGALVLAMSTAMLTAIDHDELIEADQRMISDPFKCRFTNGAVVHPVSLYFIEECALADAMLILSVLTCILVYLSLIGVGEGQFAERKMQVWWTYARVPMLVATVSLALGVIYFSTILIDLQFIKAPYTAGDPCPSINVTLMKYGKLAPVSYNGGIAEGSSGLVDTLRNSLQKLLVNGLLTLNVVILGFSVRPVNQIDRGEVPDRHPFVCCCCRSKPNLP